MASGFFARDIELSLVIGRTGSYMALHMFVCLQFLYDVIWKLEGVAARACDAAARGISGPFVPGINVDVRWFETDDDEHYEGVLLHHFDFAACVDRNDGARTDEFSFSRVNIYQSHS
jgi:hypothetical protein